jgi:hypothetical protein
LRSEQQDSQKRSAAPVPERLFKGEFGASHIRVKSAAYPCARELTITAGSDGGNGNRKRMGKTELQRFAESPS